MPSGDLGNLRPAPGSVKKEKRIGRGRGPGHGDTATRGNKGAQSRSGYRRPVWFEGGQMPIQRRLPKRGFTIRGRTEYREVKLGVLAGASGDEFNPERIRSLRLVKGRGPIVVLGTGEISRPVKLSVHRITRSALEKVLQAGGSVDILPVEPGDRRVKKGPIKVRKTKPAKS